MQFGHLKRREFLTLLGGAATAWPHMARSQQPMPVLGILNSGGTNPYAVMNKELVRGITEAGFVEGRNFSVIERFGNGQFDRLPELAAELVRMRVALLAVPAGDNAALVAKQATSTIPVVFIVGGDPVQSGLVASLNRPGGNLTGITIFTLVLGAEKRFGAAARPRSQGAAVRQGWINPANVNAGRTDTRVLTEAGRRLGLEHLTVQLASTADDIDRVFAAFAERRVARSGPGERRSHTFVNRRVQLAALAARYSLPATYALRGGTAVAGGLISYGTRLNSCLYHQSWRPWPGAFSKARSLPIYRSSEPTKFQLVSEIQDCQGAWDGQSGNRSRVRADEVGRVEDSLLRTLAAAFGPTETCRSRSPMSAVEVDRKTFARSEPYRF